MSRVNQVEKSKKSLVEALFTLFERYDYHKITVSQITAQAGVARNTFYRNFNSIDDILLYMLTSAIEEGLSSLNDKVSPSLKNMIEWRVSFAREHPYHIHIKNQPALEEMIQKFCSDNEGRVLALLNSANGESVTVNPLTSVFNQAGMNAVLEHWIRSGLKEKDDVIIEFLYFMLKNKA